MSEINLERLCLGCMAELEHENDRCRFCGWKNGTQNEPHQLVPGSFLKGKYKVGRSLGQGGFGITYIAWNIPNQYRVAIKEYYPSGQSTRGENSKVISTGSAKEFNKGLQRFYEEAQNLQKFANDPNIVKVRDFFQENGTAYIVMEFISGRTLKQYQNDLGRLLKPEEALNLLMPLVNSLEKIHAEGLLHRDISPDNIMISDMGIIKLLDFGAAREFDSNDPKTQTVNVKTGYAPPEQYQTNSERGPWIDVYAFAATIYKLLTGKRPPPSLNRFMGQSDPLEKPSNFNAAITPEQERILLKGLEINYKNRYQTVREFFNALRATVSHKGPSIKQPESGELERLRKENADLKQSNESLNAENQRNEKIVRRSKIICVVLGLLLAVTAVLFRAAVDEGNDIRGENYKVQSQLENLRTRVSNYESYEELERNLSHPSDSYFINQPVLVMKPRQNNLKVPVYCNLNTTLHFTLSYCDVAGYNKSDRNFRVSWDKGWNNHWTNLIITAGSSGGIYLIRLTNDANNVAPIIMVIVN